MESEVKILQVLNSGKGIDEHALIFKVKLPSLEKFAYIHFDVAKKKYPEAVLQYLIARIKQKPIGKCVNQSNNIKKQTNKPTPEFSKHHEEPKNINKIDQFFSVCTFCSSRNINQKMLDYDTVVDINSNLAYPVFFKLRPKVEKIAPKPKPTIKRYKKTIDQDYK